MPRCETCGSDYDKSFDVVVEGHRHSFDSFECAMHSLAPTCDHGPCRIIGHGVEAGGKMFCCASCAQHFGIKGVKDRA
jgi:hypothetical protein